jgi:hypothetical protein
MLKPDIMSTEAEGVAAQGSTDRSRTTKLANGSTARIRQRSHRMLHFRMRGSFRDLVREQRASVKYREVQHVRSGADAVRVRVRRCLDHIHPRSSLHLQKHIYLLAYGWRGRVHFVSTGESS